METLDKLEALIRTKHPSCKLMVLGQDKNGHLEILIEIDHEKNIFSFTKEFLERINDDNNKLYWTLQSIDIEPAKLNFQFK